MAENNGISSYIEAILDLGSGLDHAKSSSILLRERAGRINSNPAARHFVGEFVNTRSFDETHLSRTWNRARRDEEEKNARLENLHRRLWNFARQKKQVEDALAPGNGKRKMEPQRGTREAAQADACKDIPEGEKGEGFRNILAYNDGNRSIDPIINSVDAVEDWSGQQERKRLYIVLVSLHGLIRGEDLELGHDSDTGDQVKHVVELARNLASMPSVFRVDLFTRQICSPDLDWVYGEPTEMLALRNSEHFLDEFGECGGAYIIRIPFGPSDQYLTKELLWPHISEFVDGAISHISVMAEVLGEAICGGKPVWPAVINGHFADAGYAATLLSGALNIPLLFTGHSLGRPMMDEKKLSSEVMRQIEAEELCLDTSEIVIARSRHEIEAHWSLYDGFDAIMEGKLGVRIKHNVSCYGRFMPRMAIISPGMEHDGDMDVQTKWNEGDSTSPEPPIWSKLRCFFINPCKPMILAFAKPDPEENITTLVKAFGECHPLRELANLTLIMGHPDGIDKTPSTDTALLLSLLKLIEKYNLYGLVAYTKHPKQSEVSDTYRLVAKTKGVLINPAFVEPFGLTSIEAAAHGLPIVATKNGGSVDINRVLGNGLLVDPHDQQSVVVALLKVLSDEHLWSKLQQNGLKNFHLFSWPQHCKSYVSQIAGCKPRHPQWQISNDEDDAAFIDSPGVPQKDLQDIPWNPRFSLDDKRTVASGDHNSVESEGNAAEVKSKFEKAILAWSKDQKAGSTEKTTSINFPALTMRKHVFVIAVDLDTITGLLEVIRKIFQAVQKEKTEGSIGFILSTSLTITEIQPLLAMGGFSPSDFDAFICSSGSDLYHSTLNSEDGPFVVDFYYHSHIEYRWGGEGLRKTLVRWASSVTDKRAENEENIITTAEELSTDYCYTFKVKRPGLVPSIEAFRKLLRTQALRCHVIYCQNGARINVIPVSASRSQALRYLYLRWGVELQNIVVFVGDCGDTDYEGLLGGLHKTVILKGVGSNATRSYPLSDLLPSNSSNITQVPELCTIYDIRGSLEQLGCLNG